MNFAEEVVQCLKRQIHNEREAKIFEGGRQTTAETFIGAKSTKEQMGRQVPTLFLAMSMARKIGIGCKPQDDYDPRKIAIQTLASDPFAMFISTKSQKVDGQAASVSSAAYMASHMNMEFYKWADEFFDGRLQVCTMTVVLWAMREA